MASHTATELRDAAALLASVARRIGVEPEAMSAPQSERVSAPAIVPAALAGEISVRRGDEARTPFDIERELSGARAA